MKRMTWLVLLAAAASYYYPRAPIYALAGNISAG